MSGESRPVAIARRCFGDGDPLYERYHDTEWGFPVPDERALFELLSLEAFQAGLSWRTILAKRDAFRRAFTNFDADAVARFDPVRRQTPPGRCRHRAQSGEDRSDNRERARRPAAARGRTSAYVDPPAGSTSIAAQATSGVERRTLDDARVRSPCARPQRPRLSLPWPYYALRTDAGLRRGRRPPRRLPDTTRRRTRTPSRRVDLMTAARLSSPRLGLAWCGTVSRYY